LRASADLIVEVFSIGNPSMFHQLSNGEDKVNDIEAYPSQKLKDCGKIEFVSHNDLILSVQEHKTISRSISILSNEI